MGVLHIDAKSYIAIVSYYLYVNRRRYLMEAITSKLISGDIYIIYHDTEIISAMYAGYPSKHKTLRQCWFKVGPASKTMVQHYINIGLASCLGFMLGQRWTNIKTTLPQRLVFAGISSTMKTECQEEVCIPRS